MDNNQQLRRGPHLTPMARWLLPGPRSASAWNNSNTPSTLTGCVSSDEQTRDTRIQGSMNHYQIEFGKGEST